MTTTRSLPAATPSNSIRNCVFRRRLASCSAAERSDRMLSISSMKMTAGCISAATANSARTCAARRFSALAARRPALATRGAARLAHDSASGVNQTLLAADVSQLMAPVSKHTYESMQPFVL